MSEYLISVFLRYFYGIKKVNFQENDAVFYDLFIIKVESGVNPYTFLFDKP